ncbi:MAG: hypothetical protein MZV63_19555 [Marinilabiliales bacterium]|nr:hypothetical protein [Marinilabiliales bacterium]
MHDHDSAPVMGSPTHDSCAGASAIEGPNTTRLVRRTNTSRRRFFIGSTKDRGLPFSAGCRPVSGSRTPVSKKTCRTIAESQPQGAIQPLRRRDLCSISRGARSSRGCRHVHSLGRGGDSFARRTVTKFAVIV